VLSLGFECSKSNYCVYYKTDGDRFLFIALYVDNMLFNGKGKGIISKLKSQLVVKFEMKDIGELNTFLGWKLEEIE